MLYLAFTLIAFVVAVDQLTKKAILNYIGIGGRSITVVDNFFYIVCHRNSGAAWGILKNGRMLFLILTPIVLMTMLYIMIRYRDNLLRVSLSFIIGGAIGNYIDRLLVGSVVDFLDFYIFGYNFPTFNAADSSIVFGAALLIVYSFLYEKARLKRAGPDSKGPEYTSPDEAGQKSGGSEECGEHDGESGSDD